MKLTTRILGGAILTVAVAGTSFAASHLDPAVAGAIKARKAHMQLYAHNLGALGAMAKGSVDYNADAASAHAANLNALATLNQGSYWPQGSDSESLPDDTKALAAIWADGSDVGAKSEAMVTAAAAMNDAAGNGLEALQGAMGALGGACGACHKAYRAP